MKKVTKEFLKKHKACTDGCKWWTENCEGLSTVDQIKKLADYNFSWANWLIVRILTNLQKLQYAINAAELVLDIFEKEYPNDNGPRLAITAAKKVLIKDTKENRADAASAASAASDAAYAATSDASDAAYAASDAASAATYAASAAAYIASYAAYAASYAASAATSDASAAASAATSDATYAAYIATYAAYAAAVVDTIKSNIINFGIKLLKEAVEK